MHEGILTLQCLVLFCFELTLKKKGNEDVLGGITMCTRKGVWPSLVQSSGSCGTNGKKQGVQQSMSRQDLWETLRLLLHNLDLSGLPFSNCRRIEKGMSANASISKMNQNFYSYKSCPTFLHYLPHSWRASRLHLKNMISLVRTASLVWIVCPPNGYKQIKLASLTELHTRHCFWLPRDKAKIDSQHSYKALQGQRRPQCPVPVHPSSHASRSLQG